MELSEPVVGNGETEMSPEESWKHKEEISEAEPGGGSSGDGRPPEESTQDTMEEEEEIPNLSQWWHQQQPLRKNM